MEEEKVVDRSVRLQAIRTKLGDIRAEIADMRREDKIWEGWLEEKKDKYYIVMYLKIAVTCAKCLSFWSTLIITQNIYCAITASILAIILQKITK